MNNLPISAYKETNGLIYFARMLNKIRLHNDNNLHPDFIDNLGKALDQRLCEFLEINYTDLIKITLKNEDDENVLKWCTENGRNITENDKYIFNNFLKKYGWNDDQSDKLTFRKKELGIENRDDIQTFTDFFEIDEKRIK